MKNISSVLALIATPSLALADLYDGNKLLEACENNASFCSGYVAGAVDENFRDANVEYLIAYQTSQSVTLKDYLNYCLSEGVTVGQLRDIIKLFIYENPSRRHEEASWLVIGALKQAFPCQL